MTTVPAPRALAPRRPGRGAIVAAVLVVWVVAGAALQGQGTLELARAELTPLHTWFNDIRDWVGENRTTNPVFTYFFNVVRTVVGELTLFFQHLIAQPAFGRPVPVIGWFGVVALVTFLAGWLGNLRVAALAAAGLVFIGLQGLWEEGMDTLALTLSAVLLAVLIGLPIGIAAALSDRVHRVVTPVLDFMQTLPSFTYLAPLTLFFLIGPASATIATLIYATPPMIRYTAHGIRTVPTTAVEASTSQGATGWQRLRTVQLPMARPTIVLGLNQTIMAALAMVTVAALIDAPGLGKNVLKALSIVDVGSAFNAGLAIVVIAVLLDRITTAISRRSEASRRPLSAGQVKLRRAALAAGALVTAWAVYMSRTYVWAAEFPDDVEIGTTISRSTSAASDWITSNLSDFTNGIKNLTTTVLIDPLQALLAGSPWWLVCAAIVVLAGVIGDRTAAVTAAFCLAVVIGTGLWSDGMVTLGMTLVATAVVAVVGVVVGVWMARNARADGVIRPVLDGLQTMPSFVYLVPFFALFAASRFTAIAAAVLYAVPVTIKVVADGVRNLPVTAVEAATAAGSTPWQTITKVQLPMAMPSVALAVNQGLIYVLSMVVIGGLVGGGALGYDVVAGFSQDQLAGKGLAAGFTIVFLGIMLDRITQAAARRARS